MNDAAPVLALSGGIGGAKLALGLYGTLPPDTLTVVCNTGDDFTHLGLRICPDIDTVLYTLSGLANRELGWGRENETWTFMASLESLGGETWFRLGDGDVALHVARTQRLSAGQRLSAIMDDVRRQLGVGARIVPMSDDPVPTEVLTADGVLPFQEYFVHQQCAPVVTGFRFDGVERASPAGAFIEALEDDALRAVILCPSNPFISMDPALALPGVRDALRASRTPVVAVSPVIGGQAVKGPTAKMMRELALPVTAAAVADHYGDILDGFVIDAADEAEANDIAVPCLATHTLMRRDEDKQRLAAEVLAFADALRSSR